MKNADEATIYKAPSKTVEKIRKSLSLRDKLTTTKACLIRNAKKLKTFDLELSKL